MVCHDSILHCLIKVEDCYRQTIFQNNYTEEPLTYKADIDVLCTICIPRTFTEIFVDDEIRLAFIDFDMEIDHHRIALNLRDRRAINSRGISNCSIALATFIAERDIEPIPYSSDYFDKCFPTPIDEMSKSTFPVHFSGKHPLTERQVPRGLAREGKAQGVAVPIISLDDIPAEFDRFVWMAVPSYRSRDDGLESVIWKLLQDEGALTTLEIAHRIHSDVDISKLSALYRKLRISARSSVFVPMIGFTPAYLSTKSHLRSISLDVNVVVTWDEYSAHRSSWFTAAQLRNRVNTQLGRAAMQCLRDSLGLNLISLTEEIIYTCEGHVDTGVSFGDAYRVLHALLVTSDL